VTQAIPKNPLHKPAPEIILEGLGVSPGIAFGVAYVREAGLTEAPEYMLKKSQINDELKRFQGAVDRAVKQIERLQVKARKMPASAADEMGFMLDAYLHMLAHSRLIRGAQNRIQQQKINAESAVQAELHDIANNFLAMEDSYLAARLDDIKEVGNRLIINLMRKPIKPFSSVPAGSILIAQQLSPADMAQLNPDRIEGVATLQGGSEGHTAIMARALRLPAALCVPDLLHQIHSGDTVILDGDQGRVIINPTQQTENSYQLRQQAQLQAASELARQNRMDAETIDGVKATLVANVELPLEMMAVKEFGAEGIGLLRSEFMFMNRQALPDENEQFEILKEIIVAMDGHPVTIRTLDIGADKTSEAVLGDAEAEDMSALGLRGIRLSLARPDMLDAQLRAILRAGFHGPIRILLPMVSSVSEVRKFRDALKKVAKDLNKQDIPCSSDLPPVGVMIEIPGAALAADALAAVSDFLAIGSNDLTMYTLAIDRANERVANLYNPLHPAVLRLIQFATTAGLRARIPVSICGEIAGDPRFTALLMGLGLREFSMAPYSIPRVKQRIRKMTVDGATKRAELIMDQVDSGRIAALLDDFNALI